MNGWVASIALRPLSPVRETILTVGREKGRSRAHLPVVQDTKITGPVQNRTQVSRWSTLSRSCCSHWRTPSYCGVCIRFWYLVYSCPYTCCGVMSWRKGRVPLILNLGNRRRWIVFFTFRRLNPHQKVEWAPQSVGALLISANS